MAYFSYKYFTLACVLLASSACSQNDGQKLHSVNIFNLLAVPENYLGDRVVVPGFLAENGGAYYLVGGKDWIDYAAPSTGVAIEVKRDKKTLKSMSACVGSYVQVIAQFKVSKMTHRYALMYLESVSADMPEHNEIRPCIEIKS
ncbi:hypothetical protein [Kordiimonas marina]|uniref:hypothetical protein n=1 Tax=Kordiimonas marina TaxID=2872312 RepID=UPI001FF4396C|nr:hypothetical protein [Kordiimonas marina]MCJ9430030.1 hypothetical protein [Kordiimonas marina]